MSVVESMLRFERSESLDNLRRKGIAEEVNAEEIE